MAKPWVYIASPYTKGDPAINVHFQMRMFDSLLSDGLVIPYAPLVSHFQHAVFPRSYSDWVQYDLELLERFDAVLRLAASHDLNGKVYRQHDSAGADGEEAKARELGMPVFYNACDLYKWVRSLA